MKNLSKTEGETKEFFNVLAAFGLVILEYF